MKKGKTNKSNKAVRVDDVEDRVQAEMDRIEGRAKERAGQGLQDEELEREGRRQKEKAKERLEEQSEKR
ncbi:MAG TPA: hypothetical protein VNN73_07800 [Blastocatellia bacterium]|nr:hypothetical protein [Blastocatellia bacterium]